jgi:hypothetical protein
MVSQNFHWRPIHFNIIITACNKLHISWNGIQFIITNTVFRFDNRVFLISSWPAMHERTMVKTRWYDDTMMKTRWYDGENTMTRWWKHHTIVFLPSYHRVYTILPSCFTIVPSRFHHRFIAFNYRTIAFSPSYHLGTPYPNQVSMD